MRQTVIGLAAALVLTAGPALAQENDLRTTPSGVSEAAAATETGTDASTAESADTAGTGDVSGSGETIPPENTVDVEEGLNRDDDSVERDRGDSSILPNAEGHLESEAETMEIDCVANPEDCIQPLERPAPGPTLSEDADPATTSGDLEDPVIAEPE